MSIDEAIEQFKYDAECNRADLDLSYAEDNEQIAEWLEDYKHIKQWKSDIMDSFCKYDVNSFEELVTNTRNKAIDDFVKLAKEHDFKYGKKDITKCVIGFIEFFADKLKEENKEC